MRILVVSTPKTGNMWVRTLLARLYGLPILELPSAFSPEKENNLGKRWIAHGHYLPSCKLLEWAKRNQVILVTVIRHPADALVSLQRYIQAYQDDASVAPELVKVMVDHGDEASLDRLVAFVEGSFYCDLSISISWMRLGVSHIVRYEDLWRDPVTALYRLAAHIEETTLEKVERVVDQCALKLLRTIPGNDRKFFRKGDVGQWKELPEQVLRVMRETPPYPEQFRFLGYSLDPDDPLIVAPRQPRRSLNPFEEVTQFDNGVPVPAIAAIIFLSYKTSEARRWLPAQGTRGSDSFFNWLNARDERDAACPTGYPHLTNLAGFIYRSRSDLQAAFPDLDGPGRIGFVQWFITTASSEYALDDVFIQTVRKDFLDWANAPAQADPFPQNVPLITNYLSYLYHLRRDLQKTFPDIWARNRMDFVNWFLLTGRLELELTRDLVVPIVLSWTQSASSPVLEQTSRKPSRRSPFSFPLQRRKQRKSQS